jgi:hypothetical protein
VKAIRQIVSLLADVVIAVVAVAVASAVVLLIRLRWNRKHAPYREE